MNRFVNLIGSFFLILATVTCTFGAIITAFSFEVSTTSLFLTWLIAAILVSVLATFWRGKGILALIPLTLAAIIWKLPDVLMGAKGVIHYITGEYNKWLFIPILFQDAFANADELTFFFAAAGVALSILLSVAICFRRSAFLTIIFTVPIVLLSFVIIFHQPETWFIIGLLAVYLTLLMSSALHPDDYQKRGRAVLPAFGFALLLIGLAYLIAPPEKYTREGYVVTLDNRIRNIASQLGFAGIKFGAGWPFVSGDEWRFNTSNVNISSAGTRTITDRVVLEVISSHEGVFYLKGYSMQHFDGNRWTINSDALYLPGEEASRYNPSMIANTYRVFSPDDAPIDVVMSIDRSRDDTRHVVYVPYYSYSIGTALAGLEYGIRYDEFDQIYFNYLDKDSIIGLQEKLPEKAVYHDLATYSMMVHRRDTYLQIDNTTAEDLYEIALDAGIDPTAARSVVVDQVAQYISTSGRYTLAPYVIPENEDFALYFLQSSRQGYCIHFATVATLMLRALDIPARFTSGFVATIPKDKVGKPCELTDGNAHSWVEVFYEDVGWLPLEVTPASSDSGIPGGRPHATGGYYPPQNTDDPYYTSPGTRPSVPPVTTPGQTAVTDDSSDKERRPFFGEISTADVITFTIAFVCFAAVCIVALIIRRILAQKYREKRYTQADTNAAVICAWRYISRLHRAMGSILPPEDMEELALKARFSQHHLSEDERIIVTDYANELYGESNRNKKLLWRLWL